jgi:hypothetical protein
MRPRHSDADLVALAREGSAPAFASLLHRHRDVLQRAALRSEHPEQVAETAMAAAMRQLRRGVAPTVEVRDWLAAVVEDEVGRDPGRPGVERMLPTDWFDRTWVRAERRWPTGRSRPHVPRWATALTGAVALAAVGAGVTYVVVTAEVGTDVVSELVAEPIEDPEVLVVPGPVVVTDPEEAPELFGDVELGELPTYDLTGEGDRSAGARPAPGPSLGPPPGGAPEDAPADAPGDDDRDDGEPAEGGA